MNPASGDVPSHHPNHGEGSPPVIPDHELLRRIGGGSYGEVWLARNIMGQPRAVKVVYRGHFVEERPYQREFDGIRRFEPVSRSHPSQVTIFHVGRNDERGYFYYVLELADDRREGEGLASDGYEPRTLRSELKAQGRLPVADCLEIGLALATALAHLHKAGLVHRDIKPSNVIFVHGLPKLADIGLVTGADEECSFVGTEGYVAPEGPGKAQADIYALGMVLYEMITGLSAKEYPRLPEEWTKTPERRKLIELNQVVMKACEHDPKQRYPTADAMRAELELVSHDESLVGIRRLRRLSRALLVAVVAVAVGFGWVLFGLKLAKTTAENQRALAKEESAIRATMAAARLVGRLAGWSSTGWSSLRERARAVKSGGVPETATALLSEPDAASSTVFAGISGFSAAFSPDGRAVLSGVGTNCAHLIDTARLSQPLPLCAQGPVCWPSDGAPLLFAAVSNHYVLFEALSATVRQQFAAPESGSEASTAQPVLAITSDGRRVAAAVGNRLFVWAVHDGLSLGEAGIEATALAFSADGSLVAAGNALGETRVYAVPGLAEVAFLRPPRGGTRILCLAFGHDPDVPEGPARPMDDWLLATGDQGAEIVIWDLATQLPRSFCHGSTWLVSALTFHPNGMILASAGRNHARLWDVANGDPLLRLADQSQGASWALAFDATGQCLVVGGEANEIKSAKVAFWDLEMHRGIHVLYGLGSSPIRKVWFSPDSTRAAALSDARQLAVWDVAKDRLLFRFGVPGGSLADQAGGCFDATGRQFAVATLDEARLYDLERGLVLQGWTLTNGWANQVQFDARGRCLLLRREPVNSDEPGQDQKRYLWRLYHLSDAAEPGTIDQQDDTSWSAYGTSFAPGGRWFLVWHTKVQDGKTNVFIRRYDAANRGNVWVRSTQAQDVDLRVTWDPTGEYFGYTELKGRSRGAGSLWLRRASNPDEMIGTSPEDSESPYQAICLSNNVFASNGYIFPDLSGVKNVVRFGTDRAPLSWVSTFSPDGLFLAQGTEDGVVLVVDIPEVEKRLGMLRE